MDIKRNTSNHYIWLFLVFVCFSASLVSSAFTYDHQSNMFRYKETKSFYKGTKIHIFMTDVAYYGPDQNDNQNAYSIIVNNVSMCSNLRSNFIMGPANDDLLPSLPVSQDTDVNIAVNKITSSKTHQCFTININSDISSINLNIPVKYSRLGAYPAHNLALVESNATFDISYVYVNEFTVTDSLKPTVLPNIMSKFGDLPCYSLTKDSEDKEVYNVVSGIAKICDVNFKLLKTQLDHVNGVQTLFDNHALLINTDASLNWDILQCTITGDSKLASENTQGILSYPDSSAKNKVIFEYPRKYVIGNSNYPTNHYEVPELTCKIRWEEFNVIDWSIPSYNHVFPVTTTLIMHDAVMSTKNKDYVYSDDLSSFKLTSQLNDMMNEVIPLEPSSNYYHVYFQPRHNQVYKFTFDCDAEVAVNNDFTPKNTYSIPQCTNLPKNSNNRVDGFTCTPTLYALHQVRFALSKYNTCKMNIAVDTITPEPLLTLIPLPETTSLSSKAIMTVNSKTATYTTENEISITFVSSETSTITITPPVSFIPPIINYDDFVYDVSRCPGFTQSADSAEKLYKINSPNPSSNLFTEAEPQIVQCTVVVRLTKFLPHNEVFTHSVKLPNGKTETITTTVPLPLITASSDDNIITKNNVPLKDKENEYGFKIKLSFFMKMDAVMLYDMATFKAKATFNMLNIVINICTLQGSSDVISRSNVYGSDVYTYHSEFKAVPVDPDMLTSTDPYEFELLCNGVHTQLPDDDPDLNMSIDLKLGDTTKVYTISNFKMPVAAPIIEIVPNLDLVEIKFRPKNSIKSLQINNIGKVKPNDEILVIIDNIIAYYGPKKAGSTDDYSWTVLNEETCNNIRSQHNISVATNNSVVKPIPSALNDDVLDALIQDTISVDTKRCFSVKILKELQTLNINIPITASRYGTFPQHNINLIAVRESESEHKIIIIPSFTLTHPVLKSNAPFYVSRFNENGCNEDNTCDIIFKYDASITFSTTPFYSKFGIIIEAGKLNWEITNCKLNIPDQPETSIIARYIKNEDDNEDKSKAVLISEFNDFLGENDTSFIFPEIRCFVNWVGYDPKSTKNLPNDSKISYKIVMFDSLMSDVNVIYSAEETVDVYETFLSIVSQSGLTLNEREQLLNLYKETINKGNESGTATEVYIKDWISKTIDDMRVDEVTFSVDDEDIVKEHVEDTLEDLRNEIISDSNHSDWVIETSLVKGEGENNRSTMPKRCRTSCGKGCLCGLGKTCVDNEDCMSDICHIAKTPASRVYFLNESKGTCVNKIPEEKSDNASTSISLLLSLVLISSITILNWCY